MDEERLSAKVCRDLKRILKSRGIPQRDLETVWNLSETTISQKLNLKSSPPDIDQLGDALAVLGIDIDDFFTGIKTGFYPELALWDFLDQEPKQFPRFCRRRLRQPPQRAYESQELAEIADGLEPLRFVDPTAAYRQAVDILRFLGPPAIHPVVDPSGAAAGLEDENAEIASEVWGVLGVVQRLRGQTSTAAGAYLSGLRLSRSRVTEARTLQRLAMLLHHNSEDQEAALHAVRRARRAYREAKDDPGVGKTYVDEAAIACFCGNYRRARRLDTHALDYLTETDVESRFAALQGIAVASIFLGDHAPAATSLDQAVAALPAGRPFLSCFLHWLRGELSLASGETGKALDDLGQALDAALEAELGPFELVLLHLRMAKAHRLQEDRIAMRWTLYGLIPFQTKLRRSKAVHAILSEFLADALEDTATHVTVEALEQVYRRMREGATAANAAIMPPLLAV